VCTGGGFFNYLVMIFLDFLNGVGCRIGVIIIKEEEWEREKRLFGWLWLLLLF